MMFQKRVCSRFLIWDGFSIRYFFINCRGLFWQQCHHYGYPTHTASKTRTATDSYVCLCDKIESRNRMKKALKRHNSDVIVSIDACISLINLGKKTTIYPRILSHTFTSSHVLGLQFC